MQKPARAFCHFPVCFIIIILISAVAAYGVSPTIDSTTAKISACTWPTPTSSALDNTYRWHGLYLGGIERAITVVVTGHVIELHEKNAGAVNGLEYNFQLVDGTLDDSQAAIGRLQLKGKELEGTANTNGTETNLVRGSWSFSTNDCGTTFHLEWSADEGDYSGAYVFGPTGYEFDHGANMASCAIYNIKK